MSEPGKNVQRGQATRHHVVTVATQLFAERGYEATSIDAVLHEAGVSRGSLYHHFPGKDALFEAVLEAVEERVGLEVVSAAAGSADPVDGLRAGCQAWVRLAGDPVVQRILLVDAPSVLGWQRWRDLEERHALGLLRAALQAVADTGRLAPDLVDVFAHVVLAAMNEIALLVAQAHDPTAEQQAGTAAVDEVLDRLLGV